MEKKKEIFKGIVKTDIYDVNLKDKVCDLIINANIEFDSETYYSIDIRFDLESYKDPRLNLINIDPKENTKDRIHKLLNNQLSNISKALVEKTNATINSLSIVGDKLDNINIIEISISENGKKEYDKNGKLKKQYNVVSIMPSAPFIQEQLTKIFERKVYEEIIGSNNI